MANSRAFNNRGILIIEANDKLSYQSFSLSSVTVTGSSLTATVLGAPGVATDANFVTWIRGLFGLDK